MKTRLPLAALTLALAIGVPPGAGAAESYDNCTGYLTSLPAVISTQGTWCMNKDLATALSSGAAVTLNTNNVILDCNDFKLGGLSAGPSTAAFGVFAQNRLNLTIRNCNIRGFNRGIFVTGGDGSGHVIEDNRLEANTTFGAVVQGTAMSIRRNMVVDTGGMTFDGGPQGLNIAGNADIIDNTVDGVHPSSGGTQTGSVGIEVALSDASVIQNNRVRGVDGGNSSSYAIRIASSTFATVEANHLGVGGGGGTFGIECSFSGALVANNRLRGFDTALLGCDNDGGNIIKP